MMTRPPLSDAGRESKDEVSQVGAGGGQPHASQGEAVCSPADSRRRSAPQHAVPAEAQAMGPPAAAGMAPGLCRLAYLNSSACLMMPHVCSASHTQVIELVPYSPCWPPLTWLA
jgi:hypothetical protein